MRIGYARVSTKDQSLDMQLDALQEAGCDRIFKEHASGTKASRPELDKAMSHLRAGDTIVVYKLDRLGRSLPHLVTLVSDLKEKEIAFESLKDGIKLDDTAVGQMIFNIFASFAQFERDLIRERTIAGLEAARARGRRGGRPGGISKEARIKAAAAKTMYESGDFTSRQIQEQLNISSATMYKYLREMGVKIQTIR